MSAAKDPDAFQHQRLMTLCSLLLRLLGTYHFIFQLGHEIAANPVILSGVEPYVAYPNRFATGITIRRDQFVNERVRYQ